MSNKLEQLDFKLEKNIGIWKHAGEVRKSVLLRREHTYYKNKLCNLQSFVVNTL